jgi:hypothetical protein
LIKQFKYFNFLEKMKNVITYADGLAVGLAFCADGMSMLMVFFWLCQRMSSPTALCRRPPSAQPMPTALLAVPTAVGRRHLDCVL